MLFPRRGFQVENNYCICPGQIQWIIFDTVDFFMPLQYLGFLYDTVVTWLREIHLTSQPIVLDRNYIQSINSNVKRVNSWQQQTPLSGENHLLFPLSVLSNSKYLDDISKNKTSVCLTSMTNFQLNPLEPCLSWRGKQVCLF